MTASAPPPANAPAPADTPPTTTTSPDPASARAASAPSESAPARPEGRGARVGAEERQSPPAPRATPRRSEPAPAARDTLELPARAPRQSPRDTAPPDRAPRAEQPAAMAAAVRPRPAPDVRVEVANAPNGGAVDYTVRVSRPDGAPVTDADVRLRGLMTDGGLVEARLDPGGEPGVYRGLVTFSPRGPRSLTVRVARGGDVVELPVADPASGGRTPRP
jgi:hypothetical protein